MSRKTFSEGRRLHVLYLGVESEGYPRNARLREYLVRRFDAQISVVAIDTRPGAARKAWTLLRRGLSLPRRSVDVVILAEFQNKNAAIARAVAWWHGAALVVDWFVGLHETRVGDWMLVPDRSLHARVLDVVDRAAARLGDIVVTDTDARVQMLHSRYGAHLNRLYTLPVGAPAWAARIEQRERSDSLTRVLYYGGYLPLHGVEYILRSIARCRHLDLLRFVFVGGGQQRGRAESLAKELGIETSIVFRDPVPEARLASYIEESDVVLGVFGGSEKAATVIANKVWQGLASGRWVVSRRSPALAEVVDIVGAQLVTVDIADTMALAEALDEIALANRDGVGGAAGAGTAERLEEYVGQRFDEFGAGIERVARAHRS